MGKPIEHEGVFGLATFISGFIKAPVDREVLLKKDGLEGDGQGDLKHHGGPDKAVCVYSWDRYPRWNEELSRSLSPGAFGENFTVIGHDEESVCLGDRFRIGEKTIVEVSQPRSPCYKLAQFFRVKDLAMRFQTSGLTGWYLRVIEEGMVQQGDTLTLIERPYPRLSILSVNRLVYDRKASSESLLALSECPALSQGWSEKLSQRAASGRISDETVRLYGPR